MKTYSDNNNQEVDCTKQNEHCSICGRKLKEGQTVYKTEIGLIACKLDELIKVLNSNK